MANLPASIRPRRSGLTRGCASRHLFQKRGERRRSDSLSIWRCCSLPGKVELSFCRVRRGDEVLTVPDFFIRRPYQGWRGSDQPDDTPGWWQGCRGVPPWVPPAFATQLGRRPAYLASSKLAGQVRSRIGSPHDEPESKSTFRYRHVS